MPSVRTIQAGQVIYGKFPPEYRGGGSRDFTHLGFTPGFCDERVIDAIQWYLLGETPPQPTAPTRRIFKVIGRGEGAVAALGELSPATYADAAGRTEQYVAHLLLLHADEFETQVGGNPFYLFDQFAFVADIQQAMALVPTLSEPIEVSFEPRRDLGCEEALRWERAPQGHLSALVRLALGADDLTNDTPPKGLALVGGSKHRETTLCGLMALLAPEDRLACSFNTEAAAGASSPDAEWQLWACGAPGRLPTGRYTNVDVEQMTVEDRTGLPAVHPGPYGEWLLAKLASDAGVEEILQGRTQAIRAARVCSGETPFDADTWHSLQPVAEEVASLERVAEIVDQRVIHFAARHMAPHAPNLAQPERVRGLVGARPASERLALLGSPQAFVQQMLVNRLAAGGIMDLDEAAEWEALINALGMREHAVPALFLAALLLRRGRDDRSEDSGRQRQFRECLERASEGPGAPEWYYRECCRWFTSTGLVRPVDIFLPGKVETLLRVECVVEQLAADPQQLTQLTLTICPEYRGDPPPPTPDAMALASERVLPLFANLSERQKSDIITFAGGLPDSVRYALDDGPGFLDTTPRRPAETSEGAPGKRGQTADKPGWRDRLTPSVAWLILILLAIICVIARVYYGPPGQPPPDPAGTVHNAAPAAPGGAPPSPAQSDQSGPGLDAETPER